MIHHSSDEECNDVYAPRHASLVVWSGILDQDHTDVEGEDGILDLQLVVTLDGTFGQNGHVFLKGQFHILILCHASGGDVVQNDIWNHNYIFYEAVFGIWDRCRTVWAAIPDISAPHPVVLEDECGM